jgi:flagellar L-ring protein precursor FlgH
MSATAVKPVAFTLMGCMISALCACATARERAADYAATPPIAVPEVAINDGAIFQSGHDIPLFENSVARRVGDILTIILSERTNASKSASTTTAKNTKLDLPGPTIAGAPVTINGTEVLSMSANNKTQFDGTGDSSQSNELTGNITVTVAERMANGNLLVRGQKWIMINQGREFVRIQGIVRPIDISPSNTVPSYKVGDASISYGSQGVIEAANHKSLLARFFDSKWMPF